MDIQCEKLKVGDYHLTRRRGWVIEIMPKMVFSKKDGTWKLEPEEASDEFDKDTRYSLEEAIATAIRMSSEKHEEVKDSKEVVEKADEDKDDDETTTSECCMVCKDDKPTSIVSINLSIELALDEQFRFDNEPIPHTKLAAPTLICRKCLKSFLEDFIKNFDPKKDKLLVQICHLLEDVVNYDKSPLHLTSPEYQQILALLSLVHSDLTDWIDDHIQEDDDGDD